MAINEPAKSHDREILSGNAGYKRLPAAIERRTIPRMIPKANIVLPRKSINSLDQSISQARIKKPHRLVSAASLGSSL
jgi:hypothetical protein